VETRATILDASARLLAQSPTGDISTRAVCEAAGITQPVLYRLFRDKDGLLAATVDVVWEQYLGMKRSAVKSADPLQDLRRGWDSHVAFAIANPHAYRLIFGTALTTAPESAAEAMRLLRGDVDRLAAQGRLRVEPAEAARMVLSANSGVALALILRPAENPDLGLSTSVRDAIHRSILVDWAYGPVVDRVVAPARARSVAAMTLRSGLPDLGADLFTPAETSLLDEWLSRIQTHSSKEIS
jgi:AcrR family transcriptional regulator